MRIPVIDYLEWRDFEHYLGECEISQVGNTNANSRLFILDENTVAKVFVSNIKQTIKNITNLLLLTRKQKLYAIPTLVMPTALIKYRGIIVGYTMPYIKGQSLCTLMYDDLVSHDVVARCFQELAETVSILPAGVHIGDLHGENIIVDREGHIHIIDVDGFTVKPGFRLTCPLDRYSENIPPLFARLYNLKGHLRINYYSDMICLFRLYIQYLSGGYDMLFTDKMADYLAFLCRCGMCKEIVILLNGIVKKRKISMNNNVFLWEQFHKDELSFGNYIACSRYGGAEHRAESILLDYLED